MAKNNTTGFTLVELLIVVAIVGIITAVAIPNLLNAIDRGKQTRTMADLRALAEAVEAYSVDSTIYPTAADISALESVIQPVYMRVFPGTDGWNNAVVYVPGTTVGMGYTLRSTGKDGLMEGSPSGGATHEFDCDILFIDGQFMQWPEGLQQ